MKWDSEGDQRVRFVSTTIIEQWTHYCRAGGPGCANASPDGPCCGEGFWRTTSSDSEEELLKATNTDGKEVPIHFAKKYDLCPRCGTILI